MTETKARQSADLETSKSSDIPAIVWNISTKIRALGQLFASFNSNLPMDDDESYMGIGAILTELADELNEVRDEFEGRQYQPTREIPNNFKGDEEENDAPKS